MDENLDGLIIVNIIIFIVSFIASLTMGILILKGFIPAEKVNTHIYVMPSIMVLTWLAGFIMSICKVGR